MPSTSRDVANDIQNRSIQSTSRMECGINVRDGDGVKKIDSAFNNRIAVFQIEPTGDINIMVASLDIFFQVVRDKILRLLKALVDLYTNMKMQGELNLDGITFPAQVREISRFQRKDGITINVFGLEKTKKGHNIIGPLYHMRKRQPKHVTMTEEKLKAHLEREDCQKIASILPEPGILEFKDFQLCLKAPFVIYSDFEAVLRPIQSCSPDLTEIYYVHSHS
ncbi:hypothetical protein NQ315_002879 [Exocentrus adspersus]|uniref:Uncharacterized protein n=1 Tax=Exocentrus adspersus TaxID=1586481 RepID=A0AAV8VGK2_9CUCU|nr:hypothetical protein NQ315_002879 [Exocentrus adspersus]